MTNVIYKYPIDLQSLSRSKASLVLPPGAMILTAAFQGCNLCVWAVVDKDNNTPNPERRIAVYGTGQEFDEHPGRYVATAFYDMHGPSPLVFHVFEQTRIDPEKEKAAIAALEKAGLHYPGGGFIGIMPGKPDLYDWLVDNEAAAIRAGFYREKAREERQRREGLAGRLDPEGRRRAAEREAQRPKGDYGSEYDDL